MPPKSILWKESMVMVEVLGRGVWRWMKSDGAGRRVLKGREKCVFSDGYRHRGNHEQWSTHEKRDKGTIGQRERTKNVRDMDKEIDHSETTRDKATVQIRNLVVSWNDSLSWSSLIEIWAGSRRFKVQ